MAELDSPALRLGARIYLGALERLRPRGARTCTRAVDKNLLNFMHVGAIVSLFPNARVIHCVRDPLDCGISCFTNDLSPVGFPWTSRLSDIGHFQLQHDRLTAHWLESSARDAILQVHYEQLVDDVESWARRMIEHCGLEWDEQCLRFHETGRAVTTSSYDQVRRPIYATAVQRSRRYDAHLEPLREALRTP